MEESSHPGRRLSRRRLLEALSSAGLLAILDGCRSRVPKPTATPRPTARPSSTVPPAFQSPLSAPPTSGARLIMPGVSVAQSPLSTPTPPPSPTQPTTPTFTPRPTATPTPTATPFPPGPPTKLGLFVTRNDPRIFELLATRNVAFVKTLEYDPGFAAEIKKVSPDTVLVGRIQLQQLNLATLTDPAAAAQDFANRLLPIATDSRRSGYFDAWEAYNEPVAGNVEEMQRLAQFEAVRTRLLGKAGVRSVIGNFGTGQPPLEFWPAFRPAIEAAIEQRGYLGLHEYSAPTMQFGTPQNPLGWGSDPGQDGWLTLRYRKVYRGYLQPNRLSLPLLLTEVGIDGMVGNRPGPPGKGWRDFLDYWVQMGMRPSGGSYMEQLAWYDTQLQKDDYVLGAAIFAATSSPGWETYEVLDEVKPFLQQYISVHPLR